MNALVLVGSTGMVFGMLLTFLALHLIAHAIKSDVDRWFGSEPPDQSQIDTKPL
jgi:hypothetical protein